MRTNKKGNIIGFPNGYEMERDQTPLEGEESNQEKIEREPLPTGLRTLVVKRTLGAIIVGFATLILLIMSKDVHALFGVVVTAYLVYLAVSVVLDFRKERIVELPVICTSCTISTARKIVSAAISPSTAKSTVVFCTMEEEPSYYTFVVPGNQVEELQPNVPYVIYFSQKNPKQLLGYVQL